MLATIPGDLRRRPVRCNPLPDDLEASTVGDYIPACVATCPDDIGLMSLVVALRAFRRDSYVELVLVTLNPVLGEGLCLLSFDLFCPRGSSSTGFYPLLLLPVSFT